MFTFTFSEGSSVRNVFFISDSEEDVPELFLVVRSANMAKYGSLSPSLHFRNFRFFGFLNGLASSLHELITLRERLKVLCIKSHDLENLLNSCELY